MDSVVGFGLERRDSVGRPIASGVAEDLHRVGNSIPSAEGSYVAAYANETKLVCVVVEETWERVANSETKDQV